MPNISVDLRGLELIGEFLSAEPTGEGYGVELTTTFGGVNSFGA